MRDLTVFLDARCLQDPNYRSRGIGSHITSLLESAASVSDRPLRIVAMVDRRLQPLPTSVGDHVAAVVSHANPVVPPDGSIFIATSPMTHSPSRFMRLIGNDKVLSVAAVYDFIPYDLPGYFSTPDSALTYAACLQWLKAYDLFFAISRFTAQRLQHHVSIPESKIFVTGCALREGLRDALAATPTDQRSLIAGTPYFLLFTGADLRKNSHVAVQAFEALCQQGRTDVFLKVAGIHPSAAEAWLSGAPPELRRRVHVVGHLSDAALRQAYSNAIATVVPSLMEGFSLPIAESVACGTPVIASDIEVHRELVSEQAALFDPTSPAALASRMACALDDGNWRARMLESQRRAAENAEPQSVWRRFWGPLLQALDKRGAAGQWKNSVTSRRPRLAIVTPFPPDQSGVANYSASTVAALARSCDVSVFTDASRTQISADWHGRLAGNIDVGALLHPGFDAVVQVAGNSLFHDRILDLCEQYGGPVILHDARLTHIYAHRLGRLEFARTVERLCGHPPPEGDLDQWLRDTTPPPLFLDTLAQMADPLVVHTKPSRDLVKRLYGVEPALVPFATAARLGEADHTSAARDVARDRLGVAPGTVLVSTFGYAAASKGAIECVRALRYLRDWNIAAELHLVGSDQDLGPALATTARELGLAGFIRSYRTFVPEEVYKDYLRASDIAVQLRSYGFGQFSGTLTDCIGAGLTCIASAELAEACDAPSTVRRLHRDATSLELAEAVRSLQATAPRLSGLTQECIDYLERHSFARYARRLMEVLGFEHSC